MVDLKKYRQLIDKSFVSRMGKVSKVVGLTVESIGPDANTNDLCRIISADHKSEVLAEVIGFRDGRLLLMPFEPLNGIGIGSTVENLNTVHSVKVGKNLLGKILDGLGNPMDGSELMAEELYPVESDPPDPMERVIIDEVLSLGVKAQAPSL